MAKQLRLYRRQAQWWCTAESGRHCSVDIKGTPKRKVHTYESAHKVQTGIPGLCCNCLQDGRVADAGSALHERVLGQVNACDGAEALPIGSHSCTGKSALLTSVGNKHSASHGKVKQQCYLRFNNHFLKDASDATYSLECWSLTWRAIEEGVDQVAELVARLLVDEAPNVCRGWNQRAERSLHKFGCRGTCIYINSITHQPVSHITAKLCHSGNIITRPCKSICSQKTLYFSSRALPHQWQGSDSAAQSGRR